MTAKEQSEARRLIRVPKAFMTDHEERDLPTPEAVRVTKSHFWIDADDPALGELHADAAFYNDRSHFDDPGLFGLVMSAKATQEAIERVVPDIADRPDMLADGGGGPSAG